MIHMIDCFNQEVVLRREMLGRERSRKLMLCLCFLHDMLAYVYESLEQEGTLVDDCIRL
jgi:hypothetical protein